MLEHRIATVAVVATFFLLIIGGTVNPTESSLACPEASFVCHGQLFPEMTGGVFYEHGHRLAAMSVGLLQIALTVLLMMRRKGMRGLAIAALAMVCLQGGLGALTVHYKLPWVISTAHLMLAVTYFATLVYILFRTRPERDRAPATEDRAVLAGLRRWIAVAAGFVAVQILIGGVVRHNEATLACLDVPFCDGALLPSAGAQQLQMFHRAFGVLTALVTISVAILVLRRTAGRAALRGRRLAALAAPVLVVGQIALGVYTVLTMRAVPLAVAHFAGAAALWLLWISLYFSTREIARAESTAGGRRGAKPAGPDVRHPDTAATVMP